MIFSNNEIDHLPNHIKVVNTDAVLSRIREAVEEKLSFEPDYAYGSKIHLNKAEDFLMELHRVLKTFE